MENDEPRDLLTEHLRREAMAERPAFSQQLHHQILQQIRDERSSNGRENALANLRPRFGRWRWLTAGAAAAAIAGYLVIGPWLSRSNHVLPPDQSKAIVRSIPQSPSDLQPSSALLAAAGRPINIGGILYERLWPPGITVCLPDGIAVAEQAPPRADTQKAVSTASLVSPDWLLAVIERPTQDAASAALAEVVPPEGRFLIGLAKSRQ